MMKRFTASRIMRIYWPCNFLIFMLVVATSAGAENSGKRSSPPSTKAEETAEESPSDPDAISLHNALATPDGESSGVSIARRERVQAESDAVPRSEVNRLIVKMIDKMPSGGEYHASLESTEKLASAIQVKGDSLDIDCKIAKPSFCSSATYLLFVSVLEQLNKNKQLSFEPGVADKLRVTGQRDGVGVWGRWNANGPGTARLFEELRLGRNFTSIDEAEPGDFLKIFWNDQIGSREFGHSVVYLGRGSNGEIKYWSSNKKGGYGRAEAPLSKIKRTLFSHLSDPGRINQILYAPETESYLASMLSRSSTPEKMYEMVGITESAAAEPTPASSVGTEVKVNGTDSKVGQKKQK
jgi:hypothetical protein